MSNIFFSLFGLSSVMSGQVVDLYASSWTVSSTQSAAMWKMVSSYLLWCLWMEMNNKSFENRKRTIKEIKPLFFNTLYLWIAAVITLFYDYHDFLVLFALTN